MKYSFPAAKLPDNQEQLRAKVRGFLDEQRRNGSFSPVTSGWITYDADFSLACGRAGFIGITWPEKYGGGGRAPIERYIVLEELLAAGAPVGAHWIADRQSGPQIIRHGTERLRAELLPRIVRGELCFAIGMSEPNSGSDLASISSRAEKVEGGWRLNGRKIWTTNGHRAHYLIGLFRTQPRSDARHEGMSQFVIDMSADGVSRRPIRDMCDGEDFAEITFDDVFVSDDYLLGQPGDGWKLVTAELAFERSGAERFLSVFPLFERALHHPELFDSATYDFGRLIAHLAVLRQLSLSVAVRLADGGNSLALEAALVKDLGNAHEQEVPEVLRRRLRIMPEIDGGEMASMLAKTILSAPSFTLRGGTPEVLKGMLAKGLGLR
jgi:alkylation response protein AidB-like acyl-CoA dehydrogenase